MKVCCPLLHIYMNRFHFIILYAQINSLWNGIPFHKIRKYMKSKFWNKKKIQVGFDQFNWFPQNGNLTFLSPSWKATVVGNIHFLQISNHFYTKNAGGPDTHFFQVFSKFVRLKKNKCYVSKLVTNWKTWPKRGFFKRFFFFFFFSWAADVSDLSRSQLWNMELDFWMSKIQDRTQSWRSLLFKVFHCVCHIFSCIFWQESS